jgi:hypothetical protein
VPCSQALQLRPMRNQVAHVNRGENRRLGEHKFGRGVLSACTLRNHKSDTYEKEGSHGTKIGASLLC